MEALGAPPDLAQVPDSAAENVRPAHQGASARHGPLLGVDDAEPKVSDFDGPVTT
jgi:hypothetical protein